MTLAAVLSTTACGKKGPPLPPSSRIPAAVQQITAKRIGNDVYVSFAVPAENDDKTRPGVTRRIDLYGYTGFTEPPRGRFLDGAVLIASIPVAPAPDAKAPLPLADVMQVTTEGAAHGSLVRLVDHLEPDELVDKPLPPLVVRGRAVVVPTPRTTPLVNPVLRRFYMAIAWSDREFPSVASPVTQLLLTPLPEPPQIERVIVEPPTPLAQMLVQWEPSGGLIGFLLDRQLPLEPAPVDEPPRTSVTEPPPAPAGPTRYNIYRQTAPDPLTLPAPVVAEPSPFAVDLPVAVNAAPLEALEYRDPVALDERERCYTVRAVRGTGPTQLEGEPSLPVCERPFDVYGPAPPRDVSLIPGVGSMQLTWARNEESDIGGYLVLRREAGNDTLLSLFDVPIAETVYTDRTVTPGVRYTYVVIAVDNRVPVPNRSEPSIPVEELAR